MKIADISVSRVHAYLRIHEGRLTLDDNGSKFGTLLKVQQPIEIEPEGSLLFQIGRTLLHIDLKTTYSLSLCKK